MTIRSERTGKSLVMTLIGRLDTASTPQFERKIKQLWNDIDEITLDFIELVYISSMGLRALLQTQKSLKEQGRKLIIKNMNASIREVFEMTGFINLMVQEEKFVVVKKAEPNHLTLSLIGTMAAENVSLLRQELSLIRDANAVTGDLVAVDLDAEKLTGISPDVCSLLKAAIEETSWNKRKFAIQNVLPAIRITFENCGIGNLLAAKS